MLKEEELLKIELMTSGISVSESARREIEGRGKWPLTLADYASTSGITLELAGKIYVNAPISDYNYNFVNSTAQRLYFLDDEFFISSNGREFFARPIPVPTYFDKKNERGEKITSFGITHTDRVRISPIEGCVNSCAFCDLHNLDYRTKPAERLIEAIRIALRDEVLPAKHIMASGGSPRAEDFDYLNSVYSSVASAFPRISFDVMMTPLPGLLDAERLRNMGVNGLAINLELYNENISREIMKGKYNISRKSYLDFIARAVEVFGEGKIRSLLMVGLEPIEDTLRGVEALAERGCDPVLSPFRPSPVTVLRDRLPPKAEVLVETYERARDIVEKYPRVKLGPRCIPCMHNTLTFPDESGEYYFS